MPRSTAGDGAPFTSPWHHRMMAMSARRGSEAKLVGLLLAGALLVSCVPASNAPARPTGQHLQWRSLAPVPTPRTEVAAAGANGRIFVVGGFAQIGGTVARVEIYNVATNRWRRGPDLPVAVNHAMSASLDGVVYVAGGYLLTDEPSDRIFAFRNGTWIELPNLPEPRAAGGMVAARGRLYVVAGVGPSGLADSTLVYNPSTRTWRTIAGVPTPRQHLGVAATSGRIYAVGGRTGGLDSNLAKAERFNPSTGKWRALPNLPTARGGLGATGARGEFVIAAGGEGPSGTFEEVEAYDVDDKRWRVLPPLPTPRHGLGVVALGSVVYVLAGGPQPGLTYSDANEALDLRSLN